ncbi:hypothetical protein BO99DRAFT_345715 [Aspergillus violaceofuscus CBS 115571]|uniref:Terpene synthase n=1 Tax=Aspergillus violaceofuscus (strain CBS 115571) TaxID=1450538 RepID=A0A2V5HE17_ASPV1|nr:hypothetical protein BO99DRAFT_345715 [Aspergillus violaceofuscus CBS 115571]
MVNRESLWLSSRLQGQTLIIPDLLARVYGDWDVSRHAHEAEVRTDIEESFLTRWCPGRQKRQQLIKSNSAMLAGYFWSGRTQAYRESTLAFLKQTLEAELIQPGQKYDVADHNSGCFAEISPALRAGTTFESLRRFADFLYEYVDSVCAVQETREERLPDMDCYFANRELSIGAYPCIMAMDVNDIISLRKELNAGQFDSVIPLKMLRDTSLSAQDAVSEACEDLIQSKRVFQEAEGALSDSAEFKKLSAATKADVGKLLTGCKNMMVGNVKWSYVPFHSALSNGLLKLTAYWQA